MSDLNLKIKTEADLKALKETKAGLEETTKATKALGQNTDKLETEIKQIDAALNSEAASAVRAAEGLKKAIAAKKQAGGDTSGLKKQLGDLRNQYDLPGRNPLSKAGGFFAEAAGKLPGAGTFQSIFNGSSATVGGVGLALAGAAKSVTEFAGAEERVASLDAALAQAGQLSDSYREKLQALAGELQKTTGVADDKWVSVLARLTQFGAKPESIGMDVEAVKNLAGLMGGDVEQAVQAYSRALQGNYEIFSRYGIQVQEAGTQTEKLSKLQEQLAQRGGGQLEASNHTLIGQWRQLKNNLSDLFEAGGRWLAQTGLLQQALYGLAATAGWLAEKLGGTVPQVDGLRNALADQSITAEESERAMKRLGDEVQREVELSKSYEDALKRETAAIQAKQRAQDELTDAQLALKLAGVDSQQQSGKLSTSEAITQREQLRANARNDKLLSASKAYGEEVAAREAQIERLKQEVADAEARANEAEAAAKNNDEILQGRQKIHAEAQKERQFWQGQREGLSAYEKAGPLATGMPYYEIPHAGVKVDGLSTGSFDRGYKAIDRALSATDEWEKKKLAEYEARMGKPNNTAAVTAKQTREDSTAKQKEVTDRINALTDEIERLKAEQMLRWQKAGISEPTAALETATARQKALTQGVVEPFPKGTEVTDAVARLQMQIAELNRRTAEALDAAAETVKTTGVLSAQKIKEIKDAQDRLEQLFNQQEQQIGDLKHRVRHRD